MIPTRIPAQFSETPSVYRPVYPSFGDGASISVGRANGLAAGETAPLMLEGELKMVPELPVDSFAP